MSKHDRSYRSPQSVTARAPSAEGRVRALETPGNMAALMTLSQVSILNSSRKVADIYTGHCEVTVTVVVWSNRITTL